MQLLWSLPSSFFSAVFTTVLQCAGGDDQGTHSAAGVVPELGIGSDVDITLVGSHHEPWVPKEVPVMV